MSRLKHEKPTSLASPETQVRLSLYYYHLELDIGGLPYVDPELSEGRAASAVMVEALQSKTMLKWLS